MKKIIYFLAISGIIFGCKPKANTDTVDHSMHEEQQVQENGISLTSGSITVTEAKSLPILDAKLSLVAPTNGATFNEFKNFNFGVENYELGAQTQDKNANHCANSAQGQHIHLILNNEPYTANYTAQFEQKVPEGKYVGLAFLSRSYHESIKTKEAYQLFKFNVGKDKNLMEFDKNAPHLFYSRPKGAYSGKDTAKVLLDFYLTNVDLSEEGYKVQATINNETFVLPKWAPFLIEGLPLGESTIELTLLNSEGVAVSSPFNPVKRTITLSETAPK